jgi:hypothetical protein
MSDETAPQSRIKITWLIGTLAAFVLFVVIGAYSSRMTWTYTDYDQDRAAQRYATLAKVRHDEQALISTTEWVDQTKGIVRIPIEEAMAKEIDTLKAQSPQAGAEIAVAAPAPTTPASTNAAPAKPSVLPSAGAPGAKTAAGPAPATTKPNP